jgi:hypothetical protein
MNAQNPNNGDLGFIPPADRRQKSVAMTGSIGYGVEYCLYLAGFPGLLHLRPSPLKCVMQLLESIAIKIELDFSVGNGIKPAPNWGWNCFARGCSQG